MTPTGLARALSKLGYCSRSQAAILIGEGKVSLNGRICRDPERRVFPGKDVLRVQGASVTRPENVYVMLNKPRGLVTTAHDEQGRPTVYECLQGAASSHLAAVGRLDKASEGLLLFTNDNTWANRITDPATHLDKTYHVQISGLLDEALLKRLQQGVAHEGETLRMKEVTVLRVGEKNTWLEVTLDEGRNRHIRRILEASNIEVLRLVRISVGNLKLGELAKGQWRHLTQAEIAALGA
jgi:23S rRNA pseudouridine2605 synthase